ncbi:hypothetical protein NW762_013250 [Fusarium torreyae]|uniref:Fungal STAND N-terminal Goodbye domain-containing protein n=1 Tax=Fusarium torreyae TaxID=1237075 RepID=A0A9W8RPD1_9HYPO|nr:hypothetical protein NW762_013250 [Fusarium torreyae]
MSGDTLLPDIASGVDNRPPSTAPQEQDATVWQKWVDFGNGSNDNSLAPLEEQRQKVVDLWKRFEHHFPSESNSLQTPNSVPAIATLYEAIGQAQIAWQAKQEQGVRPVRDRFFNFAETMNEYSYLFSIIPNGDKYTSLITGVVSSVVKVSVNYRKVAEGFSEALSDVSDHLRSVKKIFKGTDSPDMRHHVIKLYCEIFELLCHALTWFTSKRKRIGAAFKKNFHDDTVVSLLNKIEKTITAIDREANYIAHGQVREIYEMVLDPRLEDRLRSVGVQSRRDGEAAVEGKLDRMKDAIGFQSTQSLVLSGKNSEERSQPDDLVEEIGSADEPTVLATEDEFIDSTSSEDEIEEQCSRYDIERFSAHLVDYRENSVQAPSPLRGDPVSLLPHEVILKIQQWINAPESKTIWVQGPPSMPHNSIVSRAAAKVYDLSFQTRLPCVVFFCQPRYTFARDKGLTQKEAGLIALLYTVIRQLVCLLPTGFPATEGLGEKNFHLLNGSMKSVSEALNLIRALLTHAPSTLIWVVDGLQLVEDKTTIPFLREFVDILKAQQTAGVHKVFFTTQGNSSVLARGVDFRERVDASRTAPPGAVLRGGSDIRQLEGPAIRRF